MITGQVKKIMKDSLLRFGNSQNVETKSISIFIHVPNEDEEVKYFHCVDFKPVKNEEGNVLYLNFKRDFLNVKIDLLGRDMLSANFLRNYFKSTAESLGKNFQKLYIMIGAKDNEAKELVLALFEGTKLIKNLKNLCWRNLVERW